MNPAEKHLREIAEESGSDWDEETAVSHEEFVSVPGHHEPIKTWYQEAGSWEPWKAFIMGKGTFSGWSASEAAENAAAAPWPKPSSSHHS